MRALPSRRRAAQRDRAAGPFTEGTMLPSGRKAVADAAGLIEFPGRTNRDPLSLGKAEPKKLCAFRSPSRSASCAASRGVHASARHLPPEPIGEAPMTNSSHTTKVLPLRLETEVSGVTDEEAYALSERARSPMADHPHASSDVA